MQNNVTNLCARDLSLLFWLLSPEVSKAGPAQPSTVCTDFTELFIAKYDSMSGKTAVRQV